MITKLASPPTAATIAPAAASHGTPNGTDSPASAAARHPANTVWRQLHAPNVADLRTRRPYKPDTLAATNPIDPVACRTPEMAP